MIARPESRPRRKRFVDHVRGVFINRYVEAAVRGLAVAWIVVDILRTINAFAYFIRS